MIEEKVSTVVHAWSSSLGRRAAEAQNMQAGYLHDGFLVWGHVVSCFGVTGADFDGLGFWVLGLGLGGKS